MCVYVCALSVVPAMNTDNDSFHCDSVFNAFCDQFITKMLWKMVCCFNVLLHQTAWRLFRARKTMKGLCRGPLLLYSLACPLTRLSAWQSLKYTKNRHSKLSLVFSFLNSAVVLQCESVVVVVA